MSEPAPAKPDTIKLVPPKERERHQNIIEFIEGYLEDAKAGKITGVAIAVIGPDSGTSTAMVSVNDGDYERLAFAVFRAAVRMTQEG